jgi:hypothetical protein
MDIFEGAKPKFGTKIIAVYKLIHRNTLKFYIGSTGNFRNRRKTHISSLRAGNHPVKELQELYSQSPHFVFELQAIGVGGGDADARERAYDLEQVLLDKHWGEPLLLNQSRNARGLELSEEREKQRIENVRAAHQKPEVRERVTKVNQALRQSDEAREQQSEISKTLWQDPDHRARMEAVWKDPDYLQRQVENQPTSKAVIAAGGKFASISQASRELGISRNAIKQKIQDLTCIDYYLEAVPREVFEHEDRHLKGSGNY